MSVPFFLSYSAQMKIFSWMQRKMQGQAASCAAKNPDHVPQEIYNEAEFSDWWPGSGLLAIGTFGLNKNLQNAEKDDQKLNLTDTQTDATSTVTPEQVLKMSDNLCSMIEEDDDDDIKAEDSSDLSGIERSISFALSRGKSKEVRTNGLKKEIGKKSFAILFMKMYKRGFLPSPGLNPMPESRIDKILRAILHKKIYPQSSSATVLAKKKCLRNKPSDSRCEDHDHRNEITATVVNKDSKWIKTDSDYIVLEI
ncbi:hypothetical protein QQ045_032527 [Rhodiola kirilowii]